MTAIADPVADPILAPRHPAARPHRQVVGEPVWVKATLILVVLAVLSVLLFAPLIAVLVSSASSTVEMNCFPGNRWLVSGVVMLDCGTFVRSVGWFCVARPLRSHDGFRLRA